MRSDAGLNIFDPATRSRRAFSARTARSTSANRRLLSWPRPDPACGWTTRPAPLGGCRVRAPEFAERRGRALLSGADRPEHGADGRLPVLATELAIRRLRRAPAR